MENPINIPRVPPTDPISPIESMMKFSSNTLDFKGTANLYLISASLSEVVSSSERPEYCVEIQVFGCSGRSTQF